MSHILTGAMRSTKSEEKGFVHHFKPKDRNESCSHRMRLDPASELFIPKLTRSKVETGAFPPRHPTLLFRKQRGFQRDRELYNFTRGWGWLRLLDWIKYTCPTLGGIVVSLLQAFLSNE